VCKSSLQRRQPPRERKVGERGKGKERDEEVMEKDSMASSTAMVMLFLSTDLLGAHVQVVLVLLRVHVVLVLSFGLHETSKLKIK
jgi:hypothetical protein